MWVAVLWAGAMFTWFFICAFVSAAVLGYRPLQVGLAVFAGQFDYGVLFAGPVGACGDAIRFAPSACRRATRSRRVPLALFARAPVNGNFVLDVLPGMVLFGFGAGHRIQFHSASRHERRRSERFGVSRSGNRQYVA